MLGLSKGGLSGWNNPAVIGGLIAAAVLLPLFVVIEGRVRSPMLDLAIFKNRLFAAASAAAFINGLSRFALMFVFVFYFQGVQGDTPIIAGIKLAPLAVGMLISSPLAGIWADRRGSRGMAVAGMLVSAAGLALMTTLERDTAYWQSGLFMFIVGIGSRDVQLAQHRRDDGHRRRPAPRDRRRRAGARAEHRSRDLDRVRARGGHLVGAEDRPVLGVLGTRQPHLERRARRRFISNMHTALWCLSIISVLGAFVAAARPKHARWRPAWRRRPRRRSRPPRSRWSRDRDDQLRSRCGSARSPS